MWNGINVLAINNLEDVLFAYLCLIRNHSEIWVNFNLNASKMAFIKNNYIEFQIEFQTINFRFIVFIKIIWSIKIFKIKI